MKLSLKSASSSFNIFIAVWLLVNLLQAGFTNLNNDEAYYWMYSRQLDWGYFDHPPMIALMMKIGYSLFQNELGARLMTVALMAGTLAIIWRMVDNESKNNESIPYFIMLAVILPAFNLFGFIATPDSPLMFFSALFLLSYKRFLEKEDWKSVAIMCFSMAAMMYSKYHAALLLVFVILSNMRLLLKPKFIIASAGALVLYAPHLLWQVRNEFPTFRYHLVDRVAGLNPSYVFEYIGNLLVFQNPVILPLAIWLIFKIKIKDKFERALVFIMYGFIFFFLIESLRYRVQPQWTALMSLPVIIFMFNALRNHPGIKKTILLTAYVMIPVMVVGRLALAIDFLPVKFFKEEYHDYKKKMRELSAIAGDLPVVFTNSYQDPSIYTFYTGKFAHSLNDLYYRKTQYDLWDFEERIHGERVLYAPQWPAQYFEGHFRKHFFFNGDSLYVNEYASFRSLTKEFVILDEPQYLFNEDCINQISFLLFNPYPYPVEIKNEEFPVSFHLGFFRNGKIESYTGLSIPDSISTIGVGDTIAVECRFNLDILPGDNYKVAVCCATGILFNTCNSRLSEAVIRKKR